MSECKEGQDIDATVNDGKKKAVTTPLFDEGYEMDELSPIRSYEPGTDYLKEVTEEEGEIKYEGKGKGRSILMHCNICDLTC